MRDYSKSKTHHLVTALYQEKVAAMEEIKKRFTDAMLNYATNHLKNIEEAPAIVAYAFERLWDYRKFAEGLDLDGYLQGIILSEIQNRNLEYILEKRITEPGYH